MPCQASLIFSSKQVANSVEWLCLILYKVQIMVCLLFNVEITKNTTEGSQQDSYNFNKQQILISCISM